MPVVDDSSATQASFWLGVVGFLVSLRSWTKDWAPVVGSIITLATTIHTISRSPSWLPRWLRRARPLHTPNNPEAEIALPSFIAATPSAPSTPSAHPASPPPPTTPTAEQPTAEQLAAVTLRANNAEERVRALQVEIAELKAAARVNARTLEELAAAHGLFVRAVFCPEKR